MSKPKPENGPVGSVIFEMLALLWNLNPNLRLLRMLLFFL